MSLGNLRSLKVLDLAANDLVTLPEDLSFFLSLEELILSSNKFNSDSTLVKPESLFNALGTIPNLKKLNLARNRFSRLHYESLKPESF